MSGDDMEPERQSSLNRIASRVGMSNVAPPPDREQLVENGMSNQEIDIQVANHAQQEALNGLLKQWCMCACCILCIVLPTNLGMLIWTTVEWHNARTADLTCDKPLKEWVWVIYCFIIYDFAFHQCVIRLCCGYNPSRGDGGPQEPAPRRVVALNLFKFIVTFGWHITGIVFIATSSDCAEKMPGLYKAIAGFASLATFIVVFILINSIGVLWIMRFMMRNGWIKTTNAANKDSLEKNTKIVRCGESCFGDSTQCSICLEDFDNKHEIRQTACQHNFHTKCLKGWLNVNHVCPLCRHDLNQGGTGVMIGGAGSADSNV